MKFSVTRPSPFSGSGGNAFLDPKQCSATATGTSASKSTRRASSSTSSRTAMRRSRGESPAGSLCPSTWLSNRPNCSESWSFPWLISNGRRPLTKTSFREQETQQYSSLLLHIIHGYQFGRCMRSQGSFHLPISSIWFHYISYEVS